MGDKSKETLNRRKKKMIVFFGSGKSCPVAKSEGLVVPGWEIKPKSDAPKEVRTPTKASGKHKNGI